MEWIALIVIAVFAGILGLYYIVKWAVKNGVKEAYKDITGKKTAEDTEIEMVLGLDTKDK